jgi:hypothetical protein
MRQIGYLIKGYNLLKDLGAPSENVNAGALRGKAKGNTATNARATAFEKKKN